MLFQEAASFSQGWWWQILLGMAIMACIGGIAWARAMRSLRKQIRLLEHSHTVEKERLRISKDMHDEVGARLTEIAVIAELAVQNLNHARSAEALGEMQKVTLITREVIDSISEIVWALNPHNDLLENLVGYVRRYAAGYFSDGPCRCSFTVPEAIPSVYLSTDVKRNIFLTVKEALHNIMKHAAASTVSIEIEFPDHTFVLRIRDNGRGFEPCATHASGNGLRNMDERVRACSGRLDILSSPGCGTTTTITIPLRSAR